MLSLYHGGPFILFFYFGLVVLLLVAAINMVKL